jgi:hypothetical protein
MSGKKKEELEIQHIVALRQYISAYEVRHVTQEAAIMNYVRQFPMRIPALIDALMNELDKQKQQ